MQKLIILASLAICCCLAAPTTERAIAEKEKEIPKESLLVHPIADTESEGHPEHEETKPQQTPAVILLHREKRENSEEKEDEAKPAPTKFLGIQNLRGELTPEEQTEDKEDHDQHETKEEKRPKRENSEEKEEKEDESKPAPTKFLGIQNLRGELSPEEQTEHKENHDQHETEEEKRPKRENSEEKEDEPKPAPTKFLGIQNLRGELSPEEQTEHKEEEEQTHNVSEDEKRPKREDTESKEDETKAATSHFIGIQNLRGELSPEEVTELKKEHAQHEAEEEKRPKRKSVETEVKEEETKAATTVKESEHEELSPEEDIEDKEYHAHHQVEEEKRPKRESTEVKEDEQKPTTTQFIGIQNLRGELSPEEQTQHEEDAAHHQVEEDEKRSKREGDATTPATTTDEAAIPQTFPEELPTHHLTKEQKRQEAAHLLLTNVNGARRRRDIPVPLVPKHQHNEQENEGTSPKPAHDYDEVQVEDLSDGTPPTHKVEHAAGSSTPKPSSTTTQHPLIRLHPVSVAELFNRPKPQAAAGTEKSEA